MPKTVRPAPPRRPRKTPRVRVVSDAAKSPLPSPAAGRSADNPRMGKVPLLLQKIAIVAATKFVAAHKDELGVPPEWFEDLVGDRRGVTSTRRGARLRWLLFDDSRAADANAVPTPSSFSYGSGDQDPHQLFVMLATLHWSDGASATSKNRNPEEQRMDGGQGLRVVMKVRPRPAPESFEFVVLTASSSLPLVPAGVRVVSWNGQLSAEDVEHLLGPAGKARTVEEAGLDTAFYGANHVGLILQDLAKGAPVPPVKFASRLIPKRIPKGGSIPGWSPDAAAYGFDGVVRSVSGADPVLERTRRFPLFAQLDKKVFKLDPPTKIGSKVLFPNRAAGVHSGRPARSWKELDHFRGNHHFGALKELRDPKNRFFIAQSRHVEAGSVNFDENAPVLVSALTDDSIRTDGAAALNAYVRGAEFFERLDERYGLPMNIHFKWVNLPIIIRYRAGVIPGGGDGSTINAQVRWAAGQVPQHPAADLEVRLALADLQSNPGRVRAINRTGAVKRAPLSIAADERWCWHEFGHVLIAGATGSLELAFAHSVGDALGAILCDPHSTLVDDKRWRGVTFPLQSLPNRRHDHLAQDGYSWSGTLARPTRYFAGVLGHHQLKRGGYCTEQIMSSTLFRLYRSLGGDARLGGKPASGARERAAEHTVALIMRGIGVLGSSVATTVDTADLYAESMMAGDLSMGGGLTIKGGTRYGGMAHKVIRWAFEQQGAFAPPAPASTFNHDAPGVPPLVDIYVKSRRTAPFPGGYEPVNFEDDAHLADRQSLWVRRSAGGTVDQSPLGGKVNLVYLKANNRGQAKATATLTRVWCAKLKAGVIPPWTDAAWVRLNPQTAGMEGPFDVPTGAAGKMFGPFRWAGAISGNQYAILAELTCEDDASNIDTNAKVQRPCATALCNVDELVAFDNNLALRVVRAT